jgi:hypothetical protein
MNRSRLFRSAWIVAGMAVTAVGFNAVSGVTIANANHTPADKVVAAGSTVAEANEGQTVTLLQSTLRTASTTDLILQLSMECSILTDNVIMGGKDVTSETAETMGDIQAWIEIDGKIVPVNQVSTSSTGATPAAGGEQDKVTFCDRVFNRTVTDREDPADGIDGSRDYLSTKSANAFNWLKLNLGNGVHSIVVKAKLTSSATPNSTAKAYIGNRTLVVQPAKLANDAAV